MNRVLPILLILAGLLGAWILYSEGSPPPSAPYPQQTDSPPRAADELAGEQSTTESPGRRLESEQRQASPNQEPIEQGGTLIQVRTPQGDRAAGATIYLFELPDPSSPIEFQRLLELTHGVFVGTSNLAILAREEGKHWSADQNGEVRVPSPSGEVVLVVEHASGTWTERREAAPPDHWPITLRADTQLKVRVVLRDGNPAPAASVSLRLGPDHTMDYARLIADEQGLARIDAQAVRLMIPPGLEEQTIPPVASIAAPLGADGLAQVTAQLSGNTGVIELPRVGSVTIVLPDGVEDTSMLSLFESVPGIDREPAVGCDRRIPVQGKVHFPYAGVGLSLRALWYGADMEQKGSIVFPGPTEEGQNLLIHWDDFANPTARTQEFVARCADADGKPIVDAVFRMSYRLLEVEIEPDFDAADDESSSEAPVAVAFHEEDPSGNRYVSSDAEGLLRFEIVNDQQVQTYHFTFAAPDPASGTWIEVPSMAVPTPGSGPFNLGTLKFGAKEAWLAGIVVDSFGAPVPDARVSPGFLITERVRGKLTEIEISGPDDPPAVETNRSGRFRIPWYKPSMPDAKPVVSVFSMDHAPVTVPMQPGDTEMRIVLPAACTLIAQISFSETNATRELSGPPVQLELWNEDQERVWVHSRVGRNQLKWERLRPGAYQLHVLDSARNPLGDPIPIQLRPQPDGAGQVVNVDLGDRLNEAQILVRQGGEALPLGQVEVFSDLDGNRISIPFESDEHVGTLFVADAKSCILVRHPKTGQWARGVLQSGVTEFELAAPIPIVLKLGHTPPESNDLLIRLRLRGAGQFTWGSYTWVNPDASGNYHFEVPEAASYRVEARISPSKRMPDLEPVDDDDVCLLSLDQADQGSFTVHLDHDYLREELVQRLEKFRKRRIR